MAKKLPVASGKKVQGKGKDKPSEPQKPVYEFPELKPELLLGLDALTQEMAESLLGWTVIGEGSGKLTELLVDEEGNKIACKKNDHNRPFDPAWAKMLSWDILNRNWADSRNSPPYTMGIGTKVCEGLTINGETIVIGRSGRVLSGQHRLIALVLACQMWEGKKPGKIDDTQHQHWLKLWKEKPTMECLIVYGVDESVRTTRTLDNVKKRTLSDVIFCDPTLYGEIPVQDRKTVARMTDSCVRMLWSRTHAKEQPFSPQATHSEMIDFIEGNPHVVQAVKAIYGLDERKKDDKGKLLPAPIGQFIAPGYAAAFLYLMGASATNPDARDADGDGYFDPKNSPRRESVTERVDGKDVTHHYVNWSEWDNAIEFWKEFVKGVTGKLSGLYDALKLLQPSVQSTDDPSTIGTAQVEYADRLPDVATALIVQAWKCWCEGIDQNEAEELYDSYEAFYGHGMWKMDKDGKRSLSLHPNCAGIDLGKVLPGRKKKEGTEGEGDGLAADAEPSEEDVEKAEAAKAEIQNEWQENGETGEGVPVPNRPYLEGEGAESEEDNETTHLDEEEEEEEEQEEEVPEPEPVVSTPPAKKGNGKHR